MTNYSQVKKPNINVAAKYGWCLDYVQSAFGTPHVEPNAWAAWMASKKHHTGTPPQGVFVPIWFSGYGGEGHVAIYYNGKIYSSPWHKGQTTHDTMPTLAETVRIYGVTYAGWSEDIVGTTVIKPVATAAPKPAAPTRKAKSGTATVIATKLNVRNAPSTAAAIAATYVKGEKFNYDSYITTNGYTWLSYVSKSGVRRYVAQGSGSTKYVQGGV